MQYQFFNVQDDTGSNIKVKCEFQGEKRLVSSLVPSINQFDFCNLRYKWFKSYQPSQYAAQNTVRDVELRCWLTKACLLIGNHGNSMHTC
jgi:hypothetical protein